MQITRKNWISWISTLLLLPALALAGEKSLVMQSYLDDLQDEVEIIINKIQYDEATDYDKFRLSQAADRLNEANEAYIGDLAFTSEVANRQPTDRLTQVNLDSETVTLFTDVRNLNGTTVTHIWLMDGKEVYRKSFNVGGDRWRIWSSKTLYESCDLQVLIYAEDNLIAVTEVKVN